MKLKDIENLSVMDNRNFSILIKQWFPNNFTGDEKCIVYNIFVDKYFLHLPTNKIIDVGGISFGTFLIQLGECNENWLWFHENCHQKIKDIKKKNIKKVHKIVDCEIELIDDKNEIKNIDDMKWKNYITSFHLEDRI